MSRRIELPTLLLAIAIAGAWLALTAVAGRLPLLALAPLGGILLAWHGSLQHEVVHGHPTRSPLLNALLAGAPFALWLPLPIYRESHLAHHRSDLTDPQGDPESYYLGADTWASLGRPRRVLHHVLNTLAGRLLLGPFVMVGRFYLREARAIRREPRRALLWLVHLVACAGVLLWVVGACGIPLWRYLLGFVYPGLAITLLRSFAEHRPDPETGRRSVVVEAGRFWSLLFLHNNLHALHHRLPGLPWYQLPARYRLLKEQLLVDNGGQCFRGYGELARRYAFTPKDSPVHPGGRT